MRFDGWYLAGIKRFLYVFMVLSVSLILGCNDNIPDQDEVFSEAAQRVEDNIVPDLVDESALVLQNLVNFLSALPEICATPVATMGSFTSSLPALQRATQLPEDLPRLDEDNGRWRIMWRHVLLADEDGVPNGGSATPVTIDLTIRFRSEQQDVIRAVPFHLVAPDAVQTTGDPTDDGAGFFLSQDALTGVWTLRWRTLDTTQAFAGRITALSGFSGAMRRLPGGDLVSSLEVNNGQTTLDFTETTAATETKGITFYVRPGETVRFELSIGSNAENTQDINRDQLRIGAQNQLLPATQEPGNFTLVSNIPSDIVGQPSWTPGVDTGTFIWQDTTSSSCPAGNDRWHIRFSTVTGVSHAFSGDLRSESDDNRPQTNLLATPVGGCPAVEIDENDTLVYDCTLGTAQEAGYDVCVTTGGRVRLEPEIDDVRDPGLVFIGAANAPPPSPIPFTVRFDMEIETTNASQTLHFFDAQVILAGNNPDTDELALNPDQVSEEPWCNNPGERVQPRVRLTDRGDYDTDRVTGSRYTLEDVEFTTPNVTTLADSSRFPDRGNIKLETRVAGEISSIDVPMEFIGPRNGGVQGNLDIETLINGVMFEFPGRPVDLTVP